MKVRIAETVATTLTVAGIVGATVVPLRHETNPSHGELPPGTRIIELTGVAQNGLWTTDDVRGGNYWQANFTPARPVLELNRPVLFRLKSADVIHTFYIPALQIGPVEVRPGHVEEVLVTPETEGVFGYYCTTMCGDPHFGMRGVVFVQRRGSTPVGPTEERAERYWRAPPPPADAGRTERGRWLFHQKGCITCHGPAGRGGIRNFNYVNDTVPALNTLAEKMFLYFPEDVDVVVGALSQGVQLSELAEDPPFPRFSAVVAKYDSIREVIKRGNPAGRKDPAGPPPPLEMPAWEFRLSDADIDAIIAYLLSLQHGEEVAG